MSENTITWTRPSGTKITTADTKGNRDEAIRLGWVPSDELDAARAEEEARLAAEARAAEEAAKKKAATARKR